MHYKQLACAGEDRQRQMYSDRIPTCSNMVHWARRWECMSVSSMCKKKWEQNFLPLSVKMLYPSKEKWQGRLLLPPSLVWATRAKGSSHNKYFCKVRRALSMSHIRTLPLNAFLHQPWNIHALCKVFMWTSVQVSPWGKSAENLKGSTHPFSVVLMSLAYWTLEVVTNDLSRQDKKTAWDQFGQSTYHLTALTHYHWLQTVII